MQEREIEKSLYAPIPQRWLWKLNLKIRPPLFLDRFIDYLLFTIIELLFCMLIYNSIIHLYRLIEGSNIPDLFTIKMSIGLGIFIVIYNLIHSKIKAKKLDLPESWKEYIETLKQEGKLQNN